MADNSGKRVSLASNSILRRSSAASDGQPLSFAQQRFWILNELAPEVPQFNIVRHLHLQGPLNVEALLHALSTIVSRHEVLRTTIRAGADGRPYQVVRQEWTLEVPVTDLREHDDGKGLRDQNGLAELVSRSWRRPFDLARDLNLRSALFRVGEQDYHLVVTVHHIAFDFLSWNIFWRELAALYQAFRTDTAPSVPDLSVQYADYALWQRDYVQSPQAAAQLAYWRRQLADLAILRFPNETASAGRQIRPGSACRTVLDPALMDRLLKLARHQRVTLFSIMLAVLKLLVMRHTGQTDLAVGVPVAGRNRIEVEGLLGCFLNTVVLRTGLPVSNPALTFNELLNRVWHTSIAALANQDVPFEWLITELAPERQVGPTPFYRVYLNAMPHAEIAPVLPDLVVTSIPEAADYPRADVALYLNREVEQYVLRLVCNRELFDPDQAGEFLAQFVLVLEQAARAPDRPITAFTLVTSSARHVLPDPTTALAEPRHAPVTVLFGRCVQVAPRAVAIRHRQREWSYAQLDASAGRIAQGLLACGITRGDIVAITGGRSYGLICTILGVLLAGGTMLTIDPTLPPRRQQQMMEEAGACALIQVGEGGRQHQPSSLPPASEGTVCTLRLQVDPDTGLATGFPQHATPVDLPILQPDDPAYVFFTSGSTGVPKGIRGTHKGISHFLAWQRDTFGIGPDDRCAQLTNLSFDPVLRDVFLPLTSGGILCLPDTDEDLGPTTVLPWLEREQITVLHSVPTLAEFWLSQAPTGAKLNCLRWLFLAGEPLSSALVNQWRQTFPRGDGESPLSIVNLYGPTETTMVKCSYAVPAEPLAGVQPLGKPLPDTQILVLSPTRHLCGIGEPGEIVIRTPFHTLGYLNAPEEQKARFVPNPFRDDDQDVVYFTGDLGRYRVDGSLDFLGRVDDQVKIRGVRVEPAEIAAVVAGHPVVSACFIQARRDEDGDAYLAAYLVLTASSSANTLDSQPPATRHPQPDFADTIRVVWSYLSERLPAVMLPKAIAILDNLPRTDHGKVDRHALPEPTLLSEVIAASDRVTVAAPRSETERTLAAAWSAVLGQDQIGVDQNFFDLGGNSLTAISAVARVRIEFGVDLPLWTLFEFPTVAEMAVVVDSLVSGAQLSGRA